MGDDSGGKAPGRYELGELFPEESDTVLEFFRVAGMFVVVALIVLALLYPFLARS